MEYRPLGRTGLSVSTVGLGTMTWGNQNTEAEGHEQMDYAVAQGVNFFDAAEMYPVPPREQTWGRTEEIIGTWFKKTGKRDDIVLATKITGRTENFPSVRGGQTKADQANIDQALADSLKRLQTDWVDLYQLHWPDRKTNFFGQRDYVYDPRHDGGTPIEETLEALDKQVKAGRIRAIGLSNETPFGLHKFLKLAEQKNLPRVASVQNPYSLLNRLYEIGLAELSIHEDAGLLAYSPIAAGVLTGKYLGGRRPKGSRLENATHSRFLNPRAEDATAKYVDIAQRYGLDPAQMAVAFTLRQPFLTSSLVGATSMAQLKNNIGAKDITLSAEVIDEIRQVHDQNPNPAP